MKRAGFGFSLLELLVASAIVGLLAGIAIPLAEIIVRREKEIGLRESLREIRTAIDAFKAASDSGLIVRDALNSGYPPKLTVLVEGVENQRDPSRAKIYFLRALPKDPFADDAISADDSWAKRSYASSADDPREGEDVYDVHSKSTQVDAKGVAYARW
jgi:general secretion pathway protein G